MQGYRVLPRDTNQALGIAQYAIDAVRGELYNPVLEDSMLVQRTLHFNLDAVAAGIHALARGTNAPTVLRELAKEIVIPSGGVALLGYNKGDPFNKSLPALAVLANCAAVRELDINGTNFGYRPDIGQLAGEFGHTDWFPVAQAGAELRMYDGKQLLRAMLAIEEIRDAHAAAASLNDRGIDHVLYGGIASAAVYGAMMGLNAQQIEGAIGLLINHSVPFRANRAGHEMNDAKGASAAMIAKAAVEYVQWVAKGFDGIKDGYRNPKSVFRQTAHGTDYTQPDFDLFLAESPEKMGIIGMHFKLGLYEHQSAGAIHGLLSLIAQNPNIVSDLRAIEAINVGIYRQAADIICKDEKRCPTTRQSADHSMYFILATLAQKAAKAKIRERDLVELWQDTMLMLPDYAGRSLRDATVPDAEKSDLIRRIQIVHDPNLDARYPDGIPTTVEIRLIGGRTYKTEVQYPLGHARNPDTQSSERLLETKVNRLLGKLPDKDGLKSSMMSLPDMDSDDVARLYRFRLE